MTSTPAKDGLSLNLEGSRLLAAFSGRLTAAEVRRLEPGFHRAVIRLVKQPAPRAVVDLTACEYISAAGLEMLLRAFQALNLADGRLALAGPGGQVLETMEISGWQALFTIAPDVDRAWQEIT